MNMSYDTQLVNKNDIQVGDIILCKDGNMRTVEDDLQRVAWVEIIA